MNIFHDIMPKDWLLLMFGALIPFLLSGVTYIIKYLSSHKNISHLCGKWHSYHWSRVNSCFEFRYDFWKIEHGFFSGLTLTQIDSQKGSLEYSGNLRFEGGHAVMEFVAKKHRQESWLFRAIDPIPVPNGNTIIKGIVLAQDFDRKIFSTIFIVSRNSIAAEEAKALLRIFTENSEDLSLRLKECFSDEDKKILKSFNIHIDDKSMHPESIVLAD